MMNLWCRVVPTEMWFPELGAAMVQLVFEDVGIEQRDPSV